MGFLREAKNKVNVTVDKITDATDETIAVCDSPKKRSFFEVFDVFKKKDAQSVEKPVSDLTVLKDSQVGEILDNLGIQSVLSVDDQVLLDTDLESLSFDQVSPVGYSISQVDLLVKKLAYTLQQYSVLLGQRNKDVQVLAEYINSLRVQDYNVLQQENSVLLQTVENLRQELEKQRALNTITPVLPQVEKNSLPALNNALPEIV